ncbi:unnamed protein product [Hyaloperonospora brassicae]|uniref:ABC transporter domain-containing protein n=1 Tax=Hyaloperonospora brassicae TaxID=162125 RepID=A0AAV0UCJ8_HYABA|nr:unnamed protein product [Hyaloperonospora brassicae]
MATSTPPSPVDLSSSESLMKHGPTVLHRFIAAKLEAAMNKAMPQMEVRFKGLSVSAKEVETRQRGDTATQLPTLFNSVKKLVTALRPKKSTGERFILQNVSGVFQPGTITLLLGQPGSGKSSLMKVLSGRFPTDKKVTISGDITYNGVPRTALSKRLPQFVSYVAQRDQHFPTLTVQETLEFAHAFCGPTPVSKRSEKLLSRGTTQATAEALGVIQALYEHYPEVVMKQLGLEVCKDTIVGNGMVRGVSGGERKRVTTGEMEFGLRYVTLMDEISTGLDSAATFDIVQTQRGITTALRKTVVMALLQPAPEVVALFDNVMLLHEGHVIYHGPRDDALEYFASLGFTCPPDRNVADFLLELGTSEQDKYQDALPSGRTYFPRRASEFAAAFRASRVHMDMMETLEAPHESELLGDVGIHMNPMPEFHRSFWAATRILVTRQTLLTMRNRAFLRGRTVMVLAMGLIYSSTFGQVDPTNVQITLGSMFQAILFVAIGQVPQVPTFMASRDVFYKHRSANFFPTSAYVLACAIAQVPFALAESVVFGTLVYWMCGFTATIDAFLCFVVLLVLTSLVFAAWFFLFTAASPDVHIAKPGSTCSISLFILFAGFVLTKSTIPSWCVWVYWLNPLAWCLRAMAVNQYRSPELDVCVYGSIDYCTQFGQTMGTYALEQYDVPSSKTWLWSGIVFLLVCYAAFMGLGCLVIEHVRFERSDHVVVFQTSTDDEVDAGTNYLLVLDAPHSPQHSGVDAASMLHRSATAVDVHRRAPSVVPVTLAFQDLWYSVPQPKNPKTRLHLLQRVNGYALPGTLTALMGSSGAGKTTLLDVLAGRKTGGTTRGRILLNGYAATDLAVRRCTGYCEQTDIHSSATTIREALTFSAVLRQDSRVALAAKLASVTECLDLLGLQAIADQLVRVSSVEQLKRVTIGVELAAQPSVLFLDEPTSGLDARAAKALMNGVRNVANTGRTVVCTIHQPSSDVFDLFDHLVLLQRGGEPVFAGELGAHAHKLVEYFEAIPGVSPLPKTANPATWVLDCIGAGVVRNTPVASAEIDFVQWFEASKEKRLMDAVMAQEGVTKPSTTGPELRFTTKRAATWWTQATWVTGRFLRTYWRTPTYTLTRCSIGLLLALVAGLTYVDGDRTSYQGVNSAVGIVYVTTLFNGIISFNGVLPLASEERAAYYRERASQTYNALWYFVGATVAEVPYVLLSCLLFTGVFYPLMGFTGLTTGLLYWLNLSLFVLLQTYMGQLFVYALPNVEAAAILGVLVNSIFFLFMGFNPPASAIPDGYKWLYAVTPQRYSLSILMALAFADCSRPPTWDAARQRYVDFGPERGCQPMTKVPVTMEHVTVKDYVESVFQFRHDELVANVGYVLLALGILRLLALLALRFINHQKR